MENSTTNGTTDLTQTSLTPTVIFEIAVFCGLFLLGIPANGLVIYVTGFKMKTTLNSVWFLNLALADFFCIFCVVFNIINRFLNSTWIFGNFCCKLFFLVRGMTTLTSIFLLAVMSVDRCLTVWAVVWSQNKRTPNKARLICVFVWLLSLVCSIPIIFYRSIVNNRCTNSEGVLAAKKLAMFRFVIGFLIPFLIISCCYVAIGVRANQIKREKKMRPFLIILAVILNFFIFWLPFHIIHLNFTEQRYIRNINGNQNDLYITAQRLYLVSYILSVFHSCLNPFLYMFMCEDFKQTLKRSVLLVLERAFAD